MAYSVAYKRSLQKTAQTLNTNGAVKPSTSSSTSSSTSGSSTSSSSGGNTMVSKATSTTLGKQAISSNTSTSSTPKKVSSTLTTSSSNTNNKNIAGVSDDVMIQLLEGKYQQSSASSAADAVRDGALQQLGELIGQDAISQDVWDAINKKFEIPSAVTEADEWIAEQLEKIQSGKTSYSDQVKDMMNKIMNREKFSYDVDTDPLFQQALASAMNSGKQAMQDTIGQASALTGGYGSTYATSAGNQAYNDFIEDAYDNLPQYYQMAMDAYQMEGEEMYRQYSMLSTEDEKEYNRNITAYDATYQHRNQIYNEAYGQHRDSISDAFNTANLQLGEYGQKLNAASSYYSATADYSDSLYTREYTKWQDSINQAMQLAQMYNSDYWNQTNFDEGVRQYEKNFTEEQRQFNESLAEQKRQHNDQMSYNWANLNKKSSGGNGGSGGGDGKTPTQKMMQDALKAYNEGNKKYNEYMASIPDSYDKGAIQNYVADYGEDWVSDYNEYSGWTIKDDTYNGGWFFGANWFGGGEDHNDTFTKGDSDALSYDQLKEKINASSMPNEKKTELLDALKKQSKN